MSMALIQMTGRCGEAQDIGGLLQHSMVGQQEILPTLASELRTGNKMEWFVALQILTARLDEDGNVLPIHI
jgi:hypothetical protein